MINIIICNFFYFPLKLNRRKIICSWNCKLCKISPKSMKLKSHQLLSLKLSGLLRERPTQAMLLMLQRYFFQFYCFTVKYLFLNLINYNNFSFIPETKTVESTVLHTLESQLIGLILFFKDSKTHFGTKYYIKK